ncbi:sulfate reduction electron transfer complex DsrMKJOP subunit DsrO [Desulfosporosinus sp. BICA1-9]|uniref:sulfate reduction electron transfer complex DsrMKJOP subunit DsrO n=1 Tax=Desulfosporosinus sp. BICA1-9 TaxID=1531958 RepID=UPI00054C1170|nr:4Fe-4S dicluster domain-containing protein [Desulfosporosinus sp. BICA1-9]KJS47682.1 MAG: 4Fe-4S ferredoxin [Peptococcaceae bacterium BRH_c23]KJS80231.1 MAG: 4Fe-4S ferredoxin [Desulfosporosinus sp. BICA1-9]HBW38487.1 4Fe-4S dicluster domain-containing protein [Desulfosporosinus sp.]
MAQKKYGMVIDLKRCVGCHTCAVACKLENNVPLGMFWNRIETIGGPHMDTPKGEYPYLEMSHLPLACQHCENAPCVKVCPVGATYKAEDGRTLIDYERCIGCRYCMSACPYNVRVFNWQEPKKIPSHDVGSADTPQRKRGVVEKCSMCEQRTNKGELPFCVESCPQRARHFGDLNDPTSEVSRLIRERKAERLLEDKGTKPQVYYIR